MRNKRALGLVCFTILAALILSLASVTAATLAEEELAEWTELSFTYIVPEGYTAVTDISYIGQDNAETAMTKNARMAPAAEEKTAIEKLVLTNAEQGMVITIIACCNDEFIGADLAALYNDRAEEIFAIIYGGDAPQGVESQVVVGGDGKPLYIEMSDDNLTLIQYVEVNAENGRLFFYGIQNTNGGGLPDSQLAVFDELLLSIAFSEG